MDFQGRTVGYLWVWTGTSSCPFCRYTEYPRENYAHHWSLKHDFMRMHKIIYHEIDVLVGFPCLLSCLGASQWWRWWLLCHDFGIPYPPYGPGRKHQRISRCRAHGWCQKNNFKMVSSWLVVSNIFSFTRICGEMIQFDDHIFQMGWFNHLPCFKRWSWFCSFVFLVLYSMIISWWTGSCFRMY